MNRLLLINNNLKPVLHTNKNLDTSKSINKFDFIEKVIYINLEKREDRKLDVEKQLALYFPPEKIIRFNAISDDKGFIGCTKSHIGAIQMAIDNKWENCLILEDDIEWIKEDFDKTYNLFVQLVNKPFDVIVLNSNNDRTYDKKTNKLYCTTSTGGYFIKKNYFNKLLTNFKSGLSLLLKDTNNHSYRIDQYWKILHKIDDWYVVVPSLCIQKDGFSDCFNVYRNFDKNRFN
jgi:glycosyl transferase family 25